MLVNLGSRKVYVQIQHNKEGKKRNTIARIYTESEFTVSTVDGKPRYTNFSETPSGIGVASVHKSDNFNRHKGLVIALERAIGEFNMSLNSPLSKAERTKIWNKMFQGKYETKELSICNKRCTERTCST
jgi:hypothetical protein